MTGRPDDPQSPRVHVVMCTYARVSRLARTLGQLTSQQGCHVSLYIWNNNFDLASRLRLSIAQAARAIEVFTYDSRENLGGYGRFLIARDLAAAQRPVVFIDDDIDLPDTALRSLLAEYAPDQISSFWAYRFDTLHDYFARRRVRPGMRADYCGTAGTICPSSIFTDPGVFACPPRYRMLEDMWLSFYALKWGMGLTASRSGISIVRDGLDSYRRLHDLKNEFFRYLVMNGWPVHVAGRNMDTRSLVQRGQGCLPRGS